MVLSLTQVSYAQAPPYTILASRTTQGKELAVYKETLVEAGAKDEKIELTCERVDHVGDFNTETLSSKYGYVYFERGEGKYAFDAGQEKWYKKSVKVDRFYKPFAKGYIAPWKLVPTGEDDIVTARYDGLKNIDLKKVRFVSEPNSAALPARLNETEQTWSM